MNKCFILLAAVGASGVAGAFAHIRAVLAADFPAPCPKYKCVMVSAYWDGNGNTIVLANYTPAGGLSITNYGQDLFAPSSGYKLPLIVTGNVVQKFDHPICIPLCGRVGTPPVWQAEQQVVAQGPRGPVARNVAYKPCTTLDEDEDAPLTTDQSTQPNPGWPPGVVIEAPPAG